MKLSIERWLTVVKWKGYSHQANWLAATTILPALEESFLLKKLKTFCTVLKNSCLILPKMLIKPLESYLTKKFYGLAIYLLHPPFQKVTQNLSLGAVF